MSTYTVSRPTPVARLVEVEAQGHYFKTSVREPSSNFERKGGGIRGNVVVFSAASRKRCLEITARLDVDGISRPWFMTVTYPNEIDCPGGRMPTPAEAKMHLEAFRKRMQRRFPKYSAIWRIEIQEKRRERFGIVAPHFHLIVFGLPYFAKDELRAFFSWVQDQWGEVTGTAAAKPFTRCERMNSWRGLMSYVAKYVAKKTPARGPAAGLTITHILPSYEVVMGRHWGIHNRKLLPWAELKTGSLFLGKWFYRLRRLAKKVFRGVPLGRWQGFSLFRTDPYQWLTLIEVLEGGF